MRRLSGLFTPALVCVVLSACSSKTYYPGCNEDPSTKGSFASNMSYAELFPGPENLTGFKNIYDRYSKLETLYFTVDFYFVDGSLLVNDPKHELINPEIYNQWLIVQTGQHYQISNGERQIRSALISSKGIDHSNILTALPDEYKNSVDERNQSVQAHNRIESVFFAHDSDTINSNGSLTLDEVKQYLLEHPEKVLVIRGRADNTGTDEYNRGLSKRRAMAVKSMLVNKGINSERVRSSWSGEFRSGKGPIYRVAELSYE